jgi:hypothetical protein
MLLTPLTITVLLLSVLAVALTLSRIAQDRMRFGSAVLWTIAWAALGIVAVFPDVLNGLLDVAHMRNRVLFGLILAAVFLVGVVFSLSGRIERTERAAQRAHQELAITNARLEKLVDQLKLQ